jgi:hypothetical protein
MQQANRYPAVGADVIVKTRDQNTLIRTLKRVQCSEQTLGSVWEDAAAQAEMNIGRQQIDLALRRGIMELLGRDRDYLAHRN